MSHSRGKPRPQGVLLLACCALVLRQCVSLRELQREHGAQRRVQTVRTVGGSSRALQEAFEGDYDEDEELDSQPKLGTGISRLGIHGEGLGYVSHNLLESDSELIALAAAVKSGDAKATGRGAQSSGSLDDEGKHTRICKAKRWPIRHDWHWEFSATPNSIRLSYASVLWRAISSLQVAVCLHGCEISPGVSHHRAG